MLQIEKQGGTHTLFSGDKGHAEGLPAHSVHSDREFSQIKEPALLCVRASR